MDLGAFDLDQRVSLAAFDFLGQQTEGDGVLPRTLLATGFTFDGTRIPLIGPQGIFKPAILVKIPISIATVPVVEGEARPRKVTSDQGGAGQGVLREGAPRRGCLTQLEILKA